jgi:hypothetical protein
VDVLEQELETVRKQKNDDNLNSKNSLGNQNEPGGENVAPEQENRNSGRSVKPFEAALREGNFDVILLYKTRQWLIYYLSIEPAFYFCNKPMSDY